MVAPPHFDILLRLASGDVSRIKEDTRQLMADYGPVSVEDAIRKCCGSCIAFGKFTSVDAQMLAQETVPFTAALLMWGRDGFPHFNLTPDFFTAVTHTDFGDPTDEPLYMPFDSFMVSFPKSDTFKGATRAFIYKMPAVDGDMRDVSTFTVRWTMNRASLLIPGDPIFSQWHIGMTRKQLVEQGERLNETTAEKYGARPLEVDEVPAIERTRTLLANVLSYIEAAGPLPTTKRERNAAPAAVERTHPTQKLYDVGRVVKLHPGIRAAMTQTSGDAAAWKLAQRFIVRGHWKNVPHGPARTLRTRKWIEPYWKGEANLANALERTYEVE